MSEVIPMRRESAGLRMATGLTLPTDAVTQTFLIVGKRGSGKSNTAARFVEQLHHARLPFVVLDPVDTWWGLKAGRDGGRGLDVYVFGGRKADLPLEPGGGALIAEVLCEHRLSMVLSVKHLSGRERSAFMVAFAQTLFQKWAGGPLHVVLEEAHELAPQMAGGRGGRDDGEAAMLGAFKRLWKLGRASGIGGTAVTQRPASLSKDITTQSEILIAHRTIGPQDIKAVGEWVKYHGEQQEILADLPTLPTGQAFVWAPEFPEGQAIGLKRTSVLLRETYDSASTPKVGEQRVEPKELAPVDLERLRAKMAATIEKAKADDPRELRRQIGDLQRQLAAANSSRTLTASPISEPVLTDTDRRLLADAVATLNAVPLVAEQETDFLDRVSVSVASAIDGVVSEWRRDTENRRRSFEERFLKSDFGNLISKIAAAAPAQPSRHTPTTIARPSAGGDHGPRPVARVSRPASSGTSTIALPKGEAATLTVAAQYPDGATREQVSILTGYKRSSRDTYIQRLREQGFVDVRQGLIVATAAGVDALGPDFEPLPTGAELRRHWLERLPEGERRVLEVLIKAHPRTVNRDDIDASTGYKRSSRDTYLQRLGMRQLVESLGRGEVKASETLFA